MDILDDMGVSKLSAKVKKKKVNYSFNSFLQLVQQQFKEKLAEQVRFYKQAYSFLPE